MFMHKSPYISWSWCGHSSNIILVINALRFCVARSGGRDDDNDDNGNNNSKTTHIWSCFTLSLINRINLTTCCFFFFSFLLRTLGHNVIAFLFEWRSLLKAPITVLCRFMTEYFFQNIIIGKSRALIHLQIFFLIQIFLWPENILKFFMYRSMVVNSNFFFLSKIVFKNKY